MAANSSNAVGGEPARASSRIMLTSRLEPAPYRTGKYPMTPFTKRETDTALQGHQNPASHRQRNDITQTQREQRGSANLEIRFPFANRVSVRKR